MRSPAARRQATVPLISVDDLEIMKMAMFRLDEAAKRIETLAHAAQTEHLRQLLAVLSRLLLAEERELSSGIADQMDDPRAALPC